MRTRGFTLLELCVALGLVAVLAGLALPSLRASLRAAAVRSATYELMAGVQQARGAAITAGRIGVLCVSDRAGNCGLADAPSPAWRTFVDGVAGAPPEPGFTRVLPQGVTVRGTRASIRFSPLALAASAATLTICDAQGVAAPRAIVISQNARARLTVARDADCGA